MIDGNAFDIANQLVGIIRYGNYTLLFLIIPGKHVTNDFLCFILIYIPLSAHAANLLESQFPAVLFQLQHAERDGQQSSL